MTSEEFAEIITLGHEGAGIEFKASGPLNARTNPGIFVIQVIKAILGMANRRHGGIVIIGVEDDENSLNPTGVDPKDIDSWKFDRLADLIAIYADPGVSFDLEVKEYNGNQYAVILVEEFDDIPVLCKRDYGHRGHQVLRNGACYVRPRRKPETSEIPTQAEMRDLLDLATDKMVSAYIERARRNGLISISMPVPRANVEGISDTGYGGVQ